MPSFAISIYQRALTSLYIHHRDVALDRRVFVACYDDILMLWIEAQNFHYLPFATCELLNLERLGVACHTAAMLAESAEIQMIVAILAALHDK